MKKKNIINIYYKTKKIIFIKKYNIEKANFTFYSYLF